MSWYKTGTITVTNGSTTVSGSGSSWVDVGTLNAGDMLLAPDGKLYEIATIGSNTGITLASNYLGTSLSGQAYSIIPIGLLPSTLALLVKSTLTTANTALTSMVRYDINTQGLTTTQQQNARTNIAALCAADVGMGYLSKSVAGSADVTLSATEAANQILNLTGTLTGNINVIVPAAARMFIVKNATSGAYSLTVKTPSGTGVVVTQGTTTIVDCDGTNVLAGVTSITGNATVTGSLTAGAGVFSGIVETTQSTSYTRIGLKNTFANSGARNWALVCGDQAFGDFSIKYSAAQGGDPYAGSVGINITAAGVVSVPATFGVGAGVIGSDGTVLQTAVNSSFQNLAAAQFGLWMFRDNTYGGFAMFYVDTGTGTCTQIANTIPNTFQLQFSGGYVQGKIASGTQNITHFCFRNQ